MSNRPARMIVAAIAAVAVAACVAPAAAAPASGSAAETATRPGPPPAASGVSVSGTDAGDAIDRLRQGLVDAFNRQDLDGLLSFLAPDVVLTWQNGEVSRGPDAVRAYYDRMMNGPAAVVAKVTADPVVDGRQVYGDWAVSHGHMRDHFVLADGTDLPFDSRFTAVVARRGDRWLVTGFHLSVAAFDNPIPREAARRGGTYGAAGGLAVGAAAGAAAAVLVGRWRRRRHRPAGAA
jgi:uncharacterized protein (TIGR02246 family)